MEIYDKFLGCFVSSPASLYNASIQQKEKNQRLGQLFRTYIWSEKGISNRLKELKNIDYGNDMKLILFQFYLNPISYELEHLKEIENYRKSEKAIGIPIIVNDENFFSKSEEERDKFLKESILKKMDLLAEVVKKKKLDTNIELLKWDLQELFSAF